MKQVTLLIAEQIKDYVLVIVKETGREYPIPRPVFDDKKKRQAVLKEIRRREAKVV